MPKIFKSKLILVPTAVVLFLAVAVFIYFPIHFKALAYTSTSYGNSKLTCYVTDGTCPGTVVFKMFDYANGGHAGSSGTYQVCCTGTGVSNLSSGTAVLKMSDTDNAHVQETGSYSTPAYLSSTAGAISCTYPTTACSTGYACLATLSDTDNAHVAGCDSSPYSIHVCCKVALTISACSSKVASDKSISLANTNIQLCSGADTGNTSDPCYPICWKGTGTPDLTSSNWKCSVCHDDSNNPISCSTQSGNTFSWSMPSGYASPANYTLVSGTLTSANPIVKFTTTNSSRKLTLAISPTNSASCSGQNTTILLPTWTEVSPF